jgi:hypothetical protein
MSKNTGLSAFRKIDVDAIDEKDDEDDLKNDDVEEGPNEAEIKRLLDSLVFFCFCFLIYTNI